MSTTRLPLPIAALAAASLAALALPTGHAGAQTPVHVPVRAPLVAQPADVNAAVPTPLSVLGYTVGERFTPHHLLLRYYEAVAAASPRVRLDTLGRSFEGREVVMAIVTSEANMQRLDAIRANAARLASGDPAADPAMPSIAWLGFTVHGNEASGTEASIALLHRLAAWNDAETRRVLDSVVVLIDPVQNPDGHERHAQDNLRLRGALGIPTTPGAMVHSGNWPGGRTSHYYFDLNRDWFIQSHPESRARVGGAFNTWWPHVAVDLHEMGSNSTYFFAPPMEPVNSNVPQGILDWWDVYAAANAAAFDAHGWPYFRREGYDEFYPGYGVSWPTLTGAVGMTYEQASSAGGAVRRTDGSVLTLRDAALHHYTAAWATVRATADNRARRVRDYAEFRRTAATDATRGGMRAVVLARGDDGRADSLAQLLVRNGIRVGSLPAGTQASGTPYGVATSGSARLDRGGYVVDLAQPQGRLARALLEPDSPLDSAFVREELEARRTGRSDRFYDVTAWSLPFTWRVRAWTTGAVPAGAQPVALAPEDAGAASASAATPAGARFGYAFAPGSESSIRLLGALLADSAVRVWWAPRAFRPGAAPDSFPQGAFVARPASEGAATDPSGAGRPFHDAVRAHAARAGATVVPLASALVATGTDLGSNSVVPVRAPRVAILGGEAVNGNSFGFTWYAFDQRLAYPTAGIDAGAVAGGILRDFDVLVVPSASNALDGALGEGGRQRLQAWVRDGGVLITLEGASSWLARESLGLSRLRPARARAGGDSSAGAPLPASVPGAIVRVTADTLSPLLAGVRDVELPVLAQGERAFATPADAEPGEVVLRHAPAQRLRLAGFLWPEAPARLAGTPYLWTERVGRGRVIAFAGDPNYRDLWRGLLPIFANAVFLGSTF